MFYIIKFKKEELKNWIISVVVAVALYLPWAHYLMIQLAHVQKGYWITPVILEKVIVFFGYYAYNSEVLTGIVAILFLIAFVIIYAKN